MTAEAKSGDRDTERTRKLPAVMSSRDEGMKKSAVLESASLRVGVPLAISGGPTAPNAACHSEEKSLLDVVAGVLRISFSNVMSSLSTSKSVDSKSTPPEQDAIIVLPYDPR